MATMQKITPFLWFNDNAEEAASFYTSVFKNSSVDGILKWPDEQGKDLPGKVQHAQIVLDGNKMMLMESLGHQFSFSEGISLTIYCEDQAEIDYYWNRLSGHGGKESMCGWLSDQFGVWWQIIPAVLPKIMEDPGKAAKAMKAFMKMKKLDVEEIVEAAEA